MSFRSEEAGVLVAGIGPHLVGASAATGKVLWKRTVGSVKTKDILRIALDGEHVVAGRGNVLLYVHQRTGEIAWNVESPVATTTLHAEGGRIYVASGGEVACFDRKGVLVWHELLHGVDAPVTLGAGGVVVHADYKA